MGGRADWEPTTAAEVALYEALLHGDQERYFRELGRTELLLPVSAEAMAGRAPMGWATWTSNDHTHLLAFTSVDSMRTCLAEHAGGARRMPFSGLSTAWPNQDWWLAVNPGLPIEGYLPPWFVAQLGRGDARLPGSAGSGPRDRLARVEAMERAKAARAAQQYQRDARGPVRVSATVASRALPSSPEPPPPPPYGMPMMPPIEPLPRRERERERESEPVTIPQPAADQRSWLQPPAHADERTWVAPPGSVREAAPVREPVQARDSGLLRDEGTTRLDPARTAEPVGATSARAAVPPRNAPPRPGPTPWESGEETVMLRRPDQPSTSQRTTRDDDSTISLRPAATTVDSPWSQPASAGAAWAEPRPVQAWEEPPRQSPLPAHSESPLGYANGHEPRPRHAEADPSFVAANAVEEALYDAANAGNTDAFLSTLLLATVLIPKAAGTTNGQWRPQPIDGEPHIVCYTSTQHLADPLEMISIRFIKLISEWPDPTWSFAVNPGTPVGATLPGGQLLALANWAAELGLTSDDAEEAPAAADRAPTVAGRASSELTVLQKAVAPSQVSYYLERGYDRVSGFVHRAHEVGHLRGPEDIRKALGLDYAGSPFAADAKEIYILRWSAYRPSLYRIPYGGQNEAAMKAMQGWVVERAPFRGNGFAPGESREVIAEFKVDSARLPHGARLMRMDAEGQERMIAVLDSDGQRWLRTDGGA